MSGIIYGLYEQIINGIINPAIRRQYLPLHLCWYDKEKLNNELT